MTRLIATLRPLMVPLGLMLTSKGLSSLSEQAEIRQAELAELDAQIEARRAELAGLGGAPAGQLQHRPDCLTVEGYGCDTPEACAVWAEAEPYRDELKRHVPRCPHARYRSEACADPDGDCTELSAFYRRQMGKWADDDQTDEEGPAPSPAKEDFPPEPSSSTRPGEESSATPLGGLLPVAAFVLGLGVTLAATHALRHRRPRPVRRELRPRRVGQDIGGAMLVDLQELTRDIEQIREQISDPEAYADEADQVEEMPADEVEDQGDEDAPATDYRCRWDGCTWAPKRKLAPETKQLRRSMHENDCPRRPASLTV